MPVKKAAYLAPSKVVESVLNSQHYLQTWELKSASKAKKK